MNKGQLGNKGHLVKWQRTCISKEQFDAKDQQLSETISTLKTGWQGRQPGPLWMGGRHNNVGGVYDWPTGHFWLPGTIIKWSLLVPRHLSSPLAMPPKNTNSYLEIWPSTPSGSLENHNVPSVFISIWHSRSSISALIYWEMGQVLKRTESHII